MELYIRIIDGQPFEHPIFGDNFRQAFPDVNINNLPPEFAKFIRIEPPSCGVYQVYEGVTYEWIDGVVTDVHHVRSMTEQERQAKINEVKASFTPTEDDWTFDESVCAWVAPKIAGSAPNVIG
tara:strand:+ start:2154 stop:2522 length:369 start_codon:yes stop_codon:yes gene_type:complete